jgi:hypothetical protein
VNDLKVIDDAFCFLFGLVGLERVQEDNFDAAIIIEDDKGNLVEDLPHVLLGMPGVSIVREASPVKAPH